ncbi:hypothetical protein QJS10_CPA10g00612 [Acorus calamus]|uniref:Uncharacterized protein n=1 Tax=Acorus calamus TaxID=4465 RepID=A0AAV9E285_ACOCL|nr:hypothetical protein QJS10_CPA10g00612 [Acorus calamus]
MDVNGGSMARKSPRGIHVREHTIDAPLRPHVLFESRCKDVQKTYPSLSPHMKAPTTIPSPSQPMPWPPPPPPPPPCLCPAPPAPLIPPS